MLYTYHKEDRPFVEMAYQSRTGFEYQVSMKKCTMAFTFFVCTELEYYRY